MKPLILAILFSATLQAQNYRQQLDSFTVYRISAVQAILAMEDDLDLRDPKVWAKNVGHFHIREIETLKNGKSKLPNGHYMAVRLIGESLLVDYFQQFPYKIAPSKTNSFYKFQIYDGNGKTVRADKILSKKTKPTLDEQTNTYGIRLFKKERKEVVQLAIGNDTILYDYESDKSYWRRRFHLGRLSRRFIGFFTQNYMRLERWLTPAHAGYFMLSQYKYRPNDTLKAVVQINRKNGSPLKGKVWVQLWGEGKKWWSDTLNVDKDGFVDFKIHLTDSMTIDKSYQLTIASFKGGRNKFNISKYFSLEDYELDRVAYTLEKKEKTDFVAGEDAVFNLFGKDQNGLYVPDGKVSILVKPYGGLIEMTDSQVFVPDTIWYKAEMQLENGPLEVKIPKSAFPNAELKYTIVAKIHDSRGEAHEKTLEFSHNNCSKIIHCELKGGHLHVRYLENGKPKPHKVKMDRSVGDLTISEDEEVMLPLVEKLDFGTDEYYFFTDSVSELMALTSSDLEKGLSVEAISTKDSIQIELANPNMLPISFFAVENDKVIHSFKSSEKSLDYRFKARRAEGTLIYAVYRLAGEMHPIKVDQVADPKQKYTLEVTLPEEVAPGQEVDAVFSVKDKNGRPVKNARISATSVNSAFKPTMDQLLVHQRLGSIFEKTKKSRNTYNNNYIKMIRSELERNKTPIPKEAIELFKADSILFYKVLSTNGIFKEVDKSVIHKESPFQVQIAPFLVKNYKFVPIQMIYLNNELVYLSSAGEYQPYSFYALPGECRIVLRTTDMEYTYKTKLPNNGKVFLSINAEAKDSNLYVRPMPQKWTSQEQGLIKSRFMSLKGGYPATHFWHSGLPVHISKGNELVGPFWGNQKINVDIYGEFRREMRFEGGFSYEIEPSRERLYEIRELPSFKWHFRELNLKSETLYEKVIPIKPKETPKTYFPLVKAKDADPKFYLDIISIKGGKPNQQHKLYIFKGGELWEETDYKLNHQPSFKLGKDSFDIYVLTESHQAYHFSTIMTRAGIMYKKLLMSANNKMSREETTEMLRKVEIKKRALFSIENYGVIMRSNINGPIISGVIKDEDGAPLEFTAIALRNINNGKMESTISTLDGSFSIQVEESGIYEASFSYIGYGELVIADINLIEGKELDLGTIALKEEGLHGQEILCVSAVPASKGDVYIESGRVLGYSGISDLESEDKISLKESVTVSSQRQNRLKGVNIITSGKKKSKSKNYRDVAHKIVPREGEIDSELFMDSIEPDEDNSAPLILRNSFSDNAFFLPRLVTGKDGLARAKVKFPDDITSWRTFAVSSHKNKLITATAKTNALKKIMAELAVPRFLTEGDEADLVGNSRNLTGDSLRVRTQFFLNGSEMPATFFWLRDFQSAKARIKADTAALMARFELIGAESDGEERKIPVVRKGLMDKWGFFLSSTNDTAFVWQPNTSLGEVRVRAENDLAYILKEDLDYLKKYPYGCNEQNASRLLALLLEDQLNNNKDNEKAINKTIKRLNEAQNKEGYWGWWANGSQSAWMTIYVLSILKKAEVAGYKIAGKELALRFIANNFTSFTAHDQIFAINTLSDEKTYLPKLANWEELKASMRHTTYDRLSYFKARQREFSDVPTDSILQFASKDIFGNLSFKDKGYGWYDNHIQNSLLAFDIFQMMGRRDLSGNVVNFWLRVRKNGGYRNTLEAALITEAILTKWFEKGKVEKPILKINGEAVSSFPFVGKMSPNAPITFEAKGGTVYFTAWQEAFNPNPKTRGDTLKIKTRLLQDNEEVKGLTFGTHVVLEAEVEAVADAEYVMINVPIPASCSYGEKGSLNPHVSHTEFFKERAAIFCERLPTGKHKFKIELEPRFTGRFYLNTASVELMYFPVVRGNNEGVTLDVK